MNDQDKHSIKRKRVTKACLVCAKSRRKCDGQQPLCGTCNNQGLACTWSDVPSRRGPPKGYRRGTADPASLLPKIGKIREHVQSLQVAYGERLVLEELHKTLFGDCLCATGAQSSSSDGTVSGQARLSPSATSGSAVARTGTGSSASDSGRDRAKARSEWSQDEQEDPANSEVDEGSSSGMAFLATSMRYMHTGSPLTPVSDSERLPMEKYNPWALRDDRVDRHPLVRSMSSTTRIIPQPEDIEVLLKTYWSVIHPHWPILYKPTFDAVSIFRIYDELPLALLYAMYALSARLAPTASFDSEIAEKFLRVAEEELRCEGPFRSDINTCTTLFLLSLYYHGEGDQRQAWVHCGVAAMMALDLGLHKSVKNLPLVEHERRVRVFWNIFVYEKILACEMGRPVLIRMVHCDPVRLSEEQPDEYETVVHYSTSNHGHTVRLYTISVFNASVDLFRIFERILSEVHSVPSPSSIRSTRERLVQELDRELDEWLIKLGPRCSYPPPNDRTPTRSLYLTHAWYHVAIILLHRPLIPRTRVGQVFASNFHHKKATEHANQLVDLLAQFAAGQEIYKLPPNDAYPIFTAALVHVFNLTVNDRVLREQARPHLEQCIEWLRGLAETWSTASQYKLLLDAFLQVAANTINHSHSFSPIVASPGAPVQHTQQAALTTAYPCPSSSALTYVHSDALIPAADSGVTQQIQQQHQQQQHQHQHQHHFSGEGEQKLTTPDIFRLENYYWNEYSANTGHQMGGYYPQPQNPEVVAQAAGGVYYDVIRILENRPS